MARIFRAKINWTGFVGAPGYSVFHARSFEADPTGEATAFRDALNLFINAIRDNLPPVVSLAIDPEIEVLEDTTGVLDDVVQLPSIAPVAGTGLAGYQGPTGAVINWRTGLIRNGRRVRGRTFIVPVSSSKFDTDGTLTAAARTDFQDAANALLGAAGVQLCIYGRPTPGAADGVNGQVISASVPDMAAVLRSRRD